MPEGFCQSLLTSWAVFGLFLATPGVRLRPTLLTAALVALLHSLTIVSASRSNR